MPSTVRGITSPDGSFTVECRQKDLLAEEEGFDYFDFEADNSLAAATGSMIWDASFAVIALLDPGHPASILDMLMGRRVLELGSGIGLAGLSCATAGAHMMLTDIRSVSEGILTQNVAANLEAFTAARSVRYSCGDSLQQQQQQQQQQQGNKAATGSTIGTARASAGSRPWQGSKPLGRGSVAAATFDFMRPVEQQPLCGTDARDAEVVLAIDIVWLKELVAPLVNTIKAILHAPAPSEEHQQVASGPDGRRCTQRTALLAFGERSSSNSKHFVCLEEVSGAFLDAGLAPSLHARHVVERMGEHMSIAILRIEPRVAT